MCVRRMGSDIVNFVIASWIVVACHYHLPALPTRSTGWRRGMEEEGMVVIALASTQHHCWVLEGRANQVRGCFHGHHFDNLFKKVFFCKNNQSYKKNQNWSLLVHVQLNSTCTDDCQFMYYPPAMLERDRNSAIIVGGYFHGVKYWKLFVAHLSGFWLFEMLLGCPEQKKFPAKKKHGGNKWAGPPICGIYNNL
jgi:hypothetical protein